MNHPDIRYKQRLTNYSRALEMTVKAAELFKSRPLSEIEKQGYIKAFEFTFELSWKVIKDYLIYQGNREIMGSRDAIRQGFSLGIITEGKTWMEMIDSRNLTSHTYDEKAIDEILIKITEDYLPLFISFKEKMTNLAEKE